MTRDGTDRDWTARTEDPGVSDAFVFFRSLTIDSWEAWLDARDAGTESPRWADLDGWERMSISDVTIKGLVRSPVDLRPLRIVWRFLQPVMDPRRAPTSFVLQLQRQAVNLAGTDPAEPLRNPDYFVGRQEAALGESETE